MTTRNKKKLAAINKENSEEDLRSTLAQNSSIPRSQEDYITQVSEEFEGRVIKRLSKEFSRTENHILGALACLDDFLMNPLIQGHSGTATETSRNAFSINQGTNEDDSQSDPHPETGLFHTQTKRNSDPEDGHDMVIGVQRERPYGHDRPPFLVTDRLLTHLMQTDEKNCNSCLKFILLVDQILQFHLPLLLLDYRDIWELLLKIFLSLFHFITKHFMVTPYQSLLKIPRIDKDELLLLYLGLFLLLFLLPFSTTSISAVFPFEIFLT